MSKMNPKKKAWKAIVTKIPRRTVCVEGNCIQYPADGQHPVYPKPCHRQCSIDEAATNKTDTPELQYCRAMRGNPNCQKCGHSWRRHMHITSVTDQVEVEVDDPLVVAHLQKKKGEKQTQEQNMAQYKEQVKKLEKERQMVIEINARCACFLKNSAILNFNDDYRNLLERQLDEAEKFSKVGQVHATKIKNLRKALAEYKEEKERFEEAVRQCKEKAPTLEDVEAGIDKLFAMQTFGGTLKDLVEQFKQIQDHDQKDFLKDHAKDTVEVSISGSTVMAGLNAGYSKLKGWFS
eukprot:m.63590 g.63590  ORF g.63590 m.63590 type:complete len:292 (+) comp19474_c0_seq1:2-877(+)